MQVTICLIFNAKLFCLPTGSRATPARWPGTTSICSSSSARRGSHMSWRLSLPHSPPAPPALHSQCSSSQLKSLQAINVNLIVALIYICPVLPRLGKSSEDRDNPLSDKCCRKTLFYLITTLNESFRPDYDFSAAKAHEFSREPSLNWVSTAPLAGSDPSTLLARPLVIFKNRKASPGSYWTDVSTGGQRSEQQHVLSSGGGVQLSGAGGVERHRSRDQPAGLWHLQVAALNYKLNSCGSCGLKRLRLQNGALLSFEFQPSLSLQLQPGPGLRPVWRRRKPLVLQLLLLQQETEEDCVSHVPLRQVRAVLLARAEWPNGDDRSCAVIWQKWNLCQLQRFERLRPSLSGQRAGHGAGRRWGGDGRLHWGQVRSSPAGIFFLYRHCYSDKMVKVTHFTSPRIKISTSFSRLVAGSPELCACEHLQASTPWPKHAKASFFFLASHIFTFWLCCLIQSHLHPPPPFFLNTRRKSSPLLALISLCKMQDCFSSPHWDTTSSSKHPVIVIFNHKLSSTKTPIQEKKKKKKTFLSLSHFQRRLPRGHLICGGHGRQKQSTHKLTFLWMMSKKKMAVWRTPARMRTDRGRPYKDLCESQAASEASVRDCDERRADPTFIFLPCLCCFSTLLWGYLL